MSPGGWMLAALAALGCPPPAVAARQVQDAVAPIEARDLLLRVTADAGEVESGKAFRLTVVRVWSKRLIPEPWSVDALAPLVARLVDETRREDALRVEETRRYRCYAFGGGELTVPAASFRARPEAGGPEQVAFSDELRLRVAPALPPGAPGPVELPGGPLPAPSSFWRPAALLALGLVALAWILGWRARRAGRVPAAPPPAAHAVALARLQRLRERRPQGPGELHDDAVEASSLVRAYIEARFSVCAPEMTTEEFLTDPETARALHGAQREMLSGFLRHCDLVKFARHAPLDAERERLLDAVEAFVLDTRADAHPPATVGNGAA